MSYTVGVFKNKEYIFCKNHHIYKTDIIITKLELKEENKEKILGDFLLSEYGPVYYRPVSREELTDIYNYCFIVVYDAQLVKEPKEKEFELDSLYWSDIDKEGVTIASKSDSIQKGWEMVERCLFAKKVKYSELERARLRLVYQKKDGVEYDSPLVIEKEIEPEEIYKYHCYYNEL